MPLDEPLELYSALFGASAGVSRSRLFRIIEAMEKSATVSFLLDTERRFVYTNPAWDRFATSNGGPGLAGDGVIGVPLFDVIPDVLKPAYLKAYDRVRSEGHTWEHIYECSSPDRFRQFRMRVHLLRKRNWFLVTNTLVAEHEHGTDAPFDEQLYGAGGVVTMCAHCRSTQRIESDQWDFVPAYVRLAGRSPRSVSHGLCPVCFAYYYPTRA